MKKIILSVICFMCVSSSAFAENWIENYGYYDNVNEISAKDRIIPYVDNIYDFDDKPNPGGESLEFGRYYIDTKYLGANNDVDTDHVYLDKLLTKEQMENNNKEITKLINGVKTTDVRTTDELQNRLKHLEERQYILEGEIRVYDTKRWQTKVYAEYSFNRQTVSEVGVKVQFKLGSSYEERLIEELNEKLEQLKGKQNDQ